MTDFTHTSEGDNNMSKYIDLAPTIKRDRTKGPITGLDGESYALTWLDSHPDQVPGRTITRTEYRDTLDHAVKISGHGDDWERGFCTGLTVSGTKLIPDPEPTNAEKLMSILESAKVIDPWSLGEYLDAHGVKAPDND